MTNCLPTVDNPPTDMGELGMAKISELDRFIAELLDHTDDIEGSRLNIPWTRSDGLWLHTPDQVKAWIKEAVAAWKADDLVP